MVQQKTDPLRPAVIARRLILLTTLLSAIVFPACSPAANQSGQPATTLIVVRHAEKNIEPENPDPALSPAGQTRAQELLRVFGDAGISAIYATQYKRTQQTVKPLSDKLGISVTQVESKKTPDLVAQIKARNSGQVIFIAGHNNSVPEIIAALGGPQLPIIPETEYDNLYIMTIPASGPPKLLKLKYGSALPAGGSMVTPP
jgi:phosphohistidine phosphatase SixA